MGYSLTSDTVPQTELWELATYTIKPRLNRLPGVSTVVVQGGQEPEFQIQPDPGQAGRDAGHRAEYPGCDLEEQPDRFARADRAQSSAGARPGERPGAHSAEIGDIVVKTTPSGTPVAHRRYRDGHARR